MSDILFNVKTHDRFSKIYDIRHCDIFNSIEQERLKALVEMTLSPFNMDNVRCLDFGCGTGNLTTHLVNSSRHVVSADISSGNLDVLSKKLSNFSDNFETVKIDGSSNHQLNGYQFEAIFIYSVLHHIPDYISCLLYLQSLLADGGVLVIDHESSPSFWSNTNDYKAQSRQISSFRKVMIRRVRQLSSFSYLQSKFIQHFKDPFFQIEGDIHVWPHDHIEWDSIDKSLMSNGMKKIYCSDYLVYNPIYDLRKYSSLRVPHDVPDMRSTVYQKCT